MAWQQLCIEIGELDPGRVEDILTALGAISVTYEGAGAQALLEPLPGSTPLWDRVRLTALFEEQADRAVIDSALGEAGIGGCDWSRLEDRCWERAWLDDFEPMRFGTRLWVCAAAQPAPDDDATRLWLDPGLAFGTGRHTTTALCLEWLDGAEMDGRTVIDYGCGSGILGIAALLLGAGQVFAIDIDPQALTATLDNARANGVGDRIEVLQSPVPGMGQADCMLANILADPLIELAPSLSGLLRAGGELVISGILDTQAARVGAAYERWFRMDQPTIRAGWARLNGTRNDRVHQVS